MNFGVFVHDISAFANQDGTLIACISVRLWRLGWADFLSFGSWIVDGRWRRHRMR